VHTPQAIPPAARGLLSLTLVPGMGPVRIARVLEAFGSYERVLGASHADLSRVPGIGDKMARSILAGLREADARLDEELARIDQAGASLVTLADDDYPPLLRQIPAAPPVLTVRGQLRPADLDRYPVAMVGSRGCTHYGIEQAGRFAGALARSGLTIVSGGARGIDTAAHRGALDAGGRTIAVLGCGITKCYPPENAALFDRIADGHGAVISELPAHTGPNADNFPARNRIISGLALGVLVIEAGLKSGALITARHAADDHGREVMGVPGRVDSTASDGTHELLKQGAHLVCSPADVIGVLEGHARHLHAGTHDAMTADPARTGLLHADAQPVEPSSNGHAQPVGDLPAPQAAILESLTEPTTADQIAERLGLDAGQTRAALTMLELAGRVRRAGAKFQRAR
jgi:DNA processing protein